MRGWGTIRRSPVVFRLDVGDLRVDSRVESALLSGEQGRHVVLEALSQAFLIGKDGVTPALVAPGVLRNVEA